MCCMIVRFGVLPPHICSLTFEFRKSTLRATCRGISRAVRRRVSHMKSEANSLLEVARKLRDARASAEMTSDGTLLYLIDIGIVHVCEALAASEFPESGSRAAAQESREPAHA